MAGTRGTTDDFEVLTEDAGTHIVVRPEGEIDIATAPVLARALEAHRHETRPVVLELAGVSFIDASGLRVLLDARAALGDLLIPRPGPPQVQRLLAVTGIDRALWRDPLPHDVETQRAAANVNHLRRLWHAYRRGGAAALAGLLAGAAPPPEGVARTWGAAELGGFWATAVSAGGTPTRYETLGDCVIVACALDGSEPPAPELTWTLYVFEGRTFIEAVPFDSESAARAYATSRRPER